MRALLPIRCLLRRLLRRITIAARPACVLAGLVVLNSLAAGLTAHEAAAQRPFVMHDALYREETARRVFFDTYALSGEIAYRPTAASPRDGEGTAPGVDPLGLSFRFDYQLAQQLDLGAIVGTTGGRTGRSLSVNWVVLKYYQYEQGVDYSFRLAVDPASGGLAGFPQMDAALIVTSPLTPRLFNDVALGVRRVRTGYDRWVRLESEAPDAPAFDAVRTQVTGWELHAMVSYGLHFDPAASNVFVTFLAEAGDYHLLETDAAPEEATDETAAAPPVPSADPLVTDYQTGVLWIRSGLEINRPGFRISPFIGLPLAQWSTEPDETLRARLSAGLRLMLR